MHILGERNEVVLELVSVHIGKTQIKLVSSALSLVTLLFLPLFQQADLKNQLGDAGYVVFGVVLFVWELLPTTLVVYFFRVRNPTKDLVSKPFSICRKYLLILIIKHIQSGFFLRFSIESLFHPIVI